MGADPSLPLWDPFTAIWRVGCHPWGLQGSPPMRVWRFPPESRPLQSMSWGSDWLRQMWRPGVPSQDGTGPLTGADQFPSFWSIYLLSDWLWHIIWMSAPVMSAVEHVQNSNFNSNSTSDDESDVLKLKTFQKLPNRKQTRFKVFFFH